MIACLITHHESAFWLVSSAQKLAEQFDKELCVISTNNQSIPSIKKKFDAIRILNFDSSTTLEAFCDFHAISFLFVQILENKRKNILHGLRDCRQLRIPYLLYKASYKLMQFDKLVVPVTFLEEETEKAQFAAAFGRFAHSSIVLLQANDYGTKAATNSQRIHEFLLKFDLKIEKIKATNDSFKVNYEAVSNAKQVNGGLLIITASREYGLDDIIFGPQEFHLIRKSTLPLLLINPRSDLYALCD